METGRKYYQVPYKSFPDDGIMIISVIVTMLTNYLGTLINDSDNMD